MNWFRHIETDLGELCLGCIQSGGTISASIASGGTRCTPFTADLRPWLWGVSALTHGGVLSLALEGYLSFDLPVR